jgi:hypothetical protein
MDKSQEILQKVGYYSTKALSISYIFVLQFIISFSFVIVLNKIFKDFNPKKADKRHVTVIIIEILAQLILVGILAFIIRNITQMFPYPLEGVYGLETKRIKEFASAPLIPFILLFFFRNLKDKMSYLSNRLSK